METIKSVETKRYEISLMQADSGLYYIRYSKQGHPKPITSESIKDLNTALCVFDVKIEEFEGN